MAFPAALKADRVNMLGYHTNLPTHPGKTRAAQDCALLSQPTENRPDAGMKLLVVGAGAREHALAATLERGTARRSSARPATPASPASVRTPAARRHRSGRRARPGGAPKASTSPSIGPEAPLAAGVADHFLAAGRPIFGPTRAAAAQLETSKAFAKDLMARHGVPTARAVVCDSAAEALAALARGDARLAGRREGRRPRRRQGRHHRGRSRRGRGGGAAGHGRRARSATPAPASCSRSASSGPEAVVLRHRGRRATTWPAAPRRTTSACSTATEGPNTGGMGAFSPSVLVDDGAARANRARDRAAGAAPAWRPRARRSRASSTAA